MAAAAAAPDASYLRLVEWTAVVGHVIMAAAALAVAVQHVLGCAMDGSRPGPGQCTTEGIGCALPFSNERWLVNIAVPSLALCAGLAMHVGLFVASWMNVAVPVSIAG